jgi:NAD(P)-dependent dehydrogenase (short-subunit alcohol dehydrogenase family)
MCKAVVPLMKAQKSGKIINIASIAGKSLNAGVGGGGAGGTGASLMPYGSQKAAVIAFTRQLAREVGPYNINVNSICPGFLYTPAWQHGTERMWEMISALPAEMLEATPGLKEMKGPRDIFLSMVDRLTPLGREQTPEDIGRLAVFLTSEDAKNITGQSINVDGGVVMD